ncbi:hypothetical protein IGB42_01114 [Andreprevotia sp. IGB-42]|uniref:protein YgfX n=1 Tax=Andreprevotia sp. IGB-42 TaxID=2497473 RepID=UPI00135AB2D7|nr:protein YgfX [Andreprevotia sp. IGB-42]KAF0814217.1 hypothetical protein IGB42_01114 [Andreprevotia sp. IGB-42]
MPPSLLISRSVIALRWAAFAHGAALLVALLLPWGWMMAALVLVAISAWRVRKAAAGPQRLDVLADGQLRVGWADGRSADAGLLPASRVTAWLTVLQLQLPQQRCVLVLWPDSAPADTLRQWRVWLRWHWPALQRAALMQMEQQ